MNLRQQACLIVGGGSIAARKLRLQKKAGALITVIAPEICQEIQEQLDDQVTHQAREFKDSDIFAYRLVTAATNNAELNLRVSILAQQHNIPVNVVDHPELCSFYTPAIIDRSPLIIAVSTSGDAPVLAKKIRIQIESLLTPSLSKLAALMGKLRSRVSKTLVDERQRRRFWEALVDSDVSEHLEAGRMPQVEQKIDGLLDSFSSADVKSGQVSLVGAGPGDPELLTLRALRIIQTADIILYDRLVSDAILELCRRDAERIYVGKRRANHSLPQKEINERLLELAQKGNHVVRLKGGDPFIFGRGGEEIELLAQHKIPFQIVPGITAASGCASYAGIPLTHRDYAHSCTFVTGHLKDGSVDLNWKQLANPAQTLVIYMGLLGLPFICQKLIEHGMRKDMPVALIEKGTTRSQRVFVSNLESIARDIENSDVHAPTIIIVGEVVKLQAQLEWFYGDGKG